jgi:hypothetical protein
MINKQGNALNKKVNRMSGLINTERIAKQSCRNGRENSSLNFGSVNMGSYSNKIVQLNDGL